MEMPQVHKENCQISKIKLCAKISNGWMLVTIFTKSSILDAWQGSEYASECSRHILVKYFYTMSFFLFHNFNSSSISSCCNSWAMVSGVIVAGSPMVAFRSASYRINNDTISRSPEMKWQIQTSRDAVYCY